MSAVVGLVFALVAGLMILVVLYIKRLVPYIFCGAKISAWEARLIPETRLREFADMPKALNILTSLEETDYKPFLAEVPRAEGLNLAAIERGLKLGLVEQYRSLLNLVPKERKRTVEKLIQRIDLWNLKTLLTAIHHGVPIERRMEEMFPSPTMPEERLEMLASAKSFEELLEFFKGTELFEVLSKALEDYEKLGLTPMLVALDKYYYTSLWREVLRKRAQRRTLKTILGYELDAVNLKLILRLKREGIAPPEEIMKHIILPSHQLSEPLLKQLALAEDVGSAVGLLRGTIYGPLLAGALGQFEATGSLLPLEKALDEGLLKLCRWMSITKPFGLAPVLTYFYLKEFEVRNLRTAIRLKAEGVKPDQIKEMLVRVPRIEF